jgi:hypothetical protein
MNFARCLFRVLDLDDQAVEGLAQQLDFDRALRVVDVPEDSLAAVAEAPNPKEARELGTKQSKSCRPPGSMGGALDASHMRERRADAPAKRPEPVDALQVNVRWSSATLTAVMVRSLDSLSRKLLHRRCEFDE